MNTRKLKATIRRLSAKAQSVRSLGWKRAAAKLEAKADKTAQLFSEVKG